MYVYIMGGTIAKTYIILGIFVPCTSSLVARLIVYILKAYVFVVCRINCDLMFSRSRMILLWRYAPWREGERERPGGV